MLSCMTTTQGVTVVGPTGQPLRLPATHPAYRAALSLLQQGLPEVQLWRSLMDLMDNPLKALVSWCERGGVRLREGGDELILNDIRLKRHSWLQFLNRLEATAGSPSLAIRLAATLGTHAGQVQVSDLCIHVGSEATDPLRLVRLERLAAEAEPGDKVLSAASAGQLFLVSYGVFFADEAGGLTARDGVVLQKAPEGAGGLAVLRDVASQPAVLGFNRTYQCEEGSVDGWLANNSFDSLLEARRDAAELASVGAEVRIVNRISRDIVRLH